MSHDRREASIKEVGYYHVILGERGMSVKAGKMRGKVPFCFSTHIHTHIHTHAHTHTHTHTQVHVG